MGYTQFYRDAIQEPEKITWKDIFSEFRNPHSKSDMEYAFLAGSSLDRAAEDTMLQKWRKPWLFWRVFWIGIALSGLSVAAWYISDFLGSTAVSTVQLAQIISPMVIPAAMMVFFWELNIPRNISIYQLLVFFLAGGILAFFATGFLFQVIPISESGFMSFMGPPLREEPAKLFAVIIFFVWFSRNPRNKIYGLTGLVIGAAVGTGFDAFESVTYALDSSGMQLLVRMLSAVAGHTVFCAPYAAALALHMKDSRLSKDAFLNQDFLGAFAISIAVHGFYDSEFSSNLLMTLMFVFGFRFSLVTFSLMDLLITTLIAGGILWFVTLSITRKCIRQAVLASWSARTAPHSLRAAPVIVGIAGCFRGQRLRLTQNSSRIGRDPAKNDLVYPGNALKISGVHCRLLLENGKLYLEDLNSKNGTYYNGVRLPVMQKIPLDAGSTFSLADSSESFRVEISVR